MASFKELIRTYDLLLSNEGQTLDLIWKLVDGDRDLYTQYKAVYRRLLDTAQLNCTKRIVDRLDAASPLVNSILEQLKEANKDLEHALKDIKTFVDDINTATVAVGITENLATIAGLTPPAEETDDTDA